MTATADVPTKKSTNDRFFKAPPSVRLAFRVLERTAPQLGARWAERIWFTLPVRREPAVPQHIQPLGKVFELPVDGHSVAGEVWGEGPAVYLMHGWAGHRGQLSPFVEPLVERGYRVVALDAPSHGESEPGAYGPRSSSIPEFATALTAVVAQYGRPAAIIAHSLGATATGVALCDGLRADRVVLLAPMASPATYAQHFAAVLGFGRRIHRRLTARVERRVGAPMHHFDVPEFGQATAMPPTLIIHDREDASIPVTDAVAIAERWPTSRLRLTTGLGHRRLLRDPDVVAEVVGFVTAAQVGAG